MFDILALMVSTYELTLILSPEVSKEDEISQVKKLVEKQGVKVTAEESWGKRILSYPINKQKEGIYVFLTVSGIGTAVHNMQSSLRTRESILRYLLLKVEKEKKTKTKEPEKEVIKDSKKKTKKG